MIPTRPRTPRRRGVRVATHARLLLLFVVCLMVLPRTACADDGYRLWLKYDAVADPEQLAEYCCQIQSVFAPASSPVLEKAQAELLRGLTGLLGQSVRRVGTIEGEGAVVVGTVGHPAIARLLSPNAVQLKPGGYVIRRLATGGREVLLIAGADDAGTLYGVFHFLRLLQTGQSLASLSVREEPVFDLRMLNHWDDLDGTNERGYAGVPIWKWDELPEVVDPRYEDYGRANASVGINATVLNNVNADARILRTDYLKKVARVADVLRPYGIAVYLSVNFGSPLEPQPGARGRLKSSIGHLKTTDPLDPDVRRGWAAKAAEVYALIPDFGGFLVKANSEGMPGPQDYGRTHADGANMLADALRPHGGRVLWRAFVYDASIDPDRAKHANLEFAKLDGQFADNVIVQIKNGPIDFQPREPLSPLFVNLRQTRMAMELQITQEYLGHSTDLVYLGTQFHEYLNYPFGCPGAETPVAALTRQSTAGPPLAVIAGVANIGSERNWTGHLFAQANWYAFGRLAWNPRLTAEDIATKWVGQTLGHAPEVLRVVPAMMLGSWESAINYQTPLGLSILVRRRDHYAPVPAARLGSYLFVDAEGIGQDRTTTGSGMTAQYCPSLRDRYDSLETCPEEYLLFFHRVPWTHTLKSDQTLWEELCGRYDAGVAYVERMRLDWDKLKGRVNPEIHLHVWQRLLWQEARARDWRSTCQAFFQQASKRSLPASRPTR